MYKGAVVGAVALAAGMTISLTSMPIAQAFTPVPMESLVGVRITESHIAQLRAVLNLTPEQHPYWMPVEAALRSIARRHRGEVGPEAARRVAAAAGPLIQVLDASQRRSAMALARHVGLDRLVASY